MAANQTARRLATRCLECLTRSLAEVCVDVPTCYLMHARNESPADSNVHALQNKIFAYVYGDDSCSDTIGIVAASYDHSESLLRASQR